MHLGSTLSLGRRQVVSEAQLRERIHLISSSNKDDMAKLRAKFDLSQLPVSLGGTMTEEDSKALCAKWVNEQVAADGEVGAWERVRKETLLVRSCTRQHVGWLLSLEKGVSKRRVSVLFANTCQSLRRPVRVPLFAFTFCSNVGLWRVCGSGFC